MSRTDPVPEKTDLARLLAALRAARDPWSRLKLMASGARALGKLTRSQRLQLIRQLGLEGAEELAEAAAGGDAETSAAIAGALQAFESDPQRLRRLAAAVADPGSRRATLSGLAAHVLDAITAPPVVATATAAAVAAAPHGGAPASPQRRGRPPTSEEASPAPPVSARAPEAVPPAPPPAPVPPKVTAPPPTPAPISPPAAEPPQLEPPPAAEAPPVPPSAPAPATPADGAPAAVSPDATPDPAATPHTGASPSTPWLGAVAGIAASSAAAPGSPSVATLGALSALRRRLAAGDVPSSEAVAALLDHELPHDWARRRALAALFARQLPASLDEALALLDRVGSAGERRWALADLAASRRWEEADWERLVAVADTPAQRRRLAARRARA